MARSIACLIVVMSVARPVLADSDGVFCVSSDYLAYELRPFATSSVASHVLRIARFDRQSGIRFTGEARLVDFQAHRLSCLPDRVEISGWGAAFESYTVGLSGGPSLPILQQRSDPSARFNSATEPSDSPQLWAEPIGQRPLDAAPHRFFLVITGSDKRVRGGIHHLRVATLVEENAKGAVQRRLELYRSTRLETIDEPEPAARYGLSSRTGRTSTVPSRAGGICAAIWIASSRFFASTR